MCGWVNVVLTFILFQVGFLGSLGTSGLDVWQKRVGWLVAMNRLANCCSRRRRCCSKRVMAGGQGADEEEGGARGGERRDSEHVYSAISALLAHYFQSSSNQHIVPSDVLVGLLLVQGAQQQAKRGGRKFRFPAEASIYHHNSGNSRQSLLSPPPPSLQAPTAAAGAAQAAEPSESVALALGEDSVGQAKLDAQLAEAEQGSQPRLLPVDRVRLKQAKHFAKYAHACYGSSPSSFPYLYSACPAPACLEHGSLLIVDYPFSCPLRVLPFPCQAGLCTCTSTPCGEFATSSPAKGCSIPKSHCCALFFSVCVVCVRTFACFRPNASLQVPPAARFRRLPLLRGL